MKIVARLRDTRHCGALYWRQAQCKGCIRITVGTASEIKAFVSALEQVIAACES